MLVLRKDLQEGIGRQVRADGARTAMRAAASPFTHRLTAGTLWPRGDHGLGEIELPVELERARLDRQRPRGRAGLGRLVDDAHLDAELGQPKRQDEAGRAGADDQNVAIQFCPPTLSSMTSNETLHLRGTHSRERTVWSNYRPHASALTSRQ